MGELPRAIELFSGIGGQSATVDGLFKIAAAFDMSPHANQTYMPARPAADGSGE